MTRTFVSSLLIYSILLVTLTSTVRAQVADQLPPAEDQATSNSSKEHRPDLKTALALESEGYARRSSVPDVKALEREGTKLPAPPPGWTKKKTALVILAAVGLAALVFVLIKYGKECVRTEPSYCVLGSDENCTCVEYKQADK